MRRFYIVYSHQVGQVSGGISISVMDRIDGMDTLEQVNEVRDAIARINNQQHVIIISWKELQI